MIFLCSICFLNFPESVISIIPLVVPSTMSIISIILFYDRTIDVEDILLTRVLVGNVLGILYEV